ncbi:MAG: AraC family transcriptional regulator [Rickettsia endosymbiont of Labidopullus appendiculatus]|nr:AraC family transcriptional regulator [Rickettsia endosymbiont of Labidopullus appendiculatus]
MTYVNSNNFTKAVKFIYQNLDEPINLELIAKNIGISVSTLKRLFLDATELSAGSFIRRLRMERAFRSLKNKEDSILEIALSSGFEDASAFTRSFKKNFGYSPSFARNKVSIVNELECVLLTEPEIIEIEDFKIQAVTKQGLYFEVAPLAWKTLKEYLNEEVFGDDFTGTFVAIGHDNPHDGEIAEDQVRFSAGINCLSTDFMLEQITIAGGGYAKFNYTGKLNNMGLAYHYIYGAWLNKSTIKIDDTKPAFMMMDKFPDNFEEYRVSIYVPLIN